MCAHIVVLEAILTDILCVRDDQGENMGLSKCSAKYTDSSSGATLTLCRGFYSNLFELILVCVDIVVSTQLKCTAIVHLKSLGPILRIIGQRRNSLLTGTDTNYMCLSSG